MAATEANECSICCQPFTSSRRKPIKCQNPECEDICCLECFETGLLTNESPIPRCMFCDNSIQLSHIRDGFLEVTASRMARPCCFDSC